MTEHVIIRSHICFIASVSFSSEKHAPRFLKSKGINKA
uniref:Uncharacterized protein n=1 Tax=Arundo donax TaxID=35708 RepID=A0A0A9G1N3_ARUDO